MKLSIFAAALACVQSCFAISIDSVTVVAPESGAAVPVFGKLETSVALSGVAATSFYEPNPALSGLNMHATFTAPNAAHITVNGFYDGSAWRIRFSPTQIGNWNFTVSATDSSGTATWTGGTFSCIASTYPGFAKVNGRYLKFTNGTTCFAVGHNNGWQYDVEQPAFTSMAAMGENLLSFWLASPWIIPSDNIPRTPIENATEGIGNYNQASCAYIDGVLSRAESANVYLLPSIWPHDLLCSGIPAGWPASWSNNAYSSVCAAGDFYTTGTTSDTPQWRYQKNYYRYLIARWGYSRAIAGWVSVVEVDGTTGFVQNSAQVTTWSGKLSAYFAANDVYRTGSTPPLSMSRVDVPSFDSGLGMRATDSYSSKTNNLAVAQTLATQTTTMRTSGKPVFHAEFGGDVLNGATQPAHLHHGTWGAFASGAAMTPLLWCDGGNYPMMTDPNVGLSMRTHLQALANFTNGLGYQGDATLTPATLSLSSSSLRGWSMRTSNKAFGWIQNSQSGNIKGTTLTVSGLAAGKYTIAFYDVWNSGSTPFSTQSPITVKANGQLSATLPTLTHPDVAFSIHPAP